MEPKKIRLTKHSGPEAKIQQKILNLLRQRGWFCVVTHGNEFQSGLPDIFACHSRYGQRWIEVKNPESYKFTPAQLDVFPKMCSNGSAVWILISDAEDEYQKLFKAANWFFYLSVMK